MAAFRILSLDGGGVRGVFSTRVLERIERERPGTLGAADLTAGTSTGGILALGLACGRSPAELLRLYTEHAQDVFHDTGRDDLRDVGRLLGAEYDQRRLKWLLERELGASRRLNQLRGRRVLVPAFDLDDGDDPRRDPSAPRMWKPKFFHNFPGPDSDGAERVVDVALRTSASPTLFPSYQGYVDGGVIANNPSMAAIAQALDARAGGCAPEDLVLLSIGTGRNPTYIGGAKHDWGLVRWAPRLVSLMLDGLTGVADYQCRRLLGERYRRLDVVLPRPVALDAVGDVPFLIELADALELEPLLGWLDRSWTSR